MSLHADEQFLAAVAAALGETIALVRRRGFPLEPAAANGDPRAADSCSRHRHVEDDDVLDLSAHGSGRRRCRTGMRPPGNFGSEARSCVSSNGPSRPTTS